MESDEDIYNDKEKTETISEVNQNVEEITERVSSSAIVIGENEIVSIYEESGCQLSYHSSVSRNKTEQNQFTFSAADKKV